MDGLIMDEPLLLSTLLWRTERIFGDKEIVTRLGSGSYHRYTYADYGKRVRRLANALTALGVKFGDRVATMAWNNYRHFETCFGVPGIGAVLHTVNLRLFPEQQHYLINHAEDSILIIDEDQVPLVEELAAAGLPSVRAYIILADGPLPDTRLSPVYSYEELLAAASDEFDFPQFDEHSAAGMCYTSATTGLPKGVVYTHRGFVLQALALAMHNKLNLSEEQVWMVVSPIFHANASLLPHTVLMQGGTLVLPGKHPMPEDYVETVADLKVTGMNGVVTIGNMMRDYILASGKPWDMTSLTTMWLGGQAPSRAIMEWWEDNYGTHVLQGYGMTETSPQICFYALKTNLRDLPADEIFKLRQMQGLPMPLMKIKIVGENGEELPWDGVSLGDIYVRSPYVASAYYNDERTAESMIDGWFRTGDVGTIHPEGYVILKDRSKDLIKSGGEWISSIDLENALMAHPKVKEATVVSVHHPKWEERPVAVVVPSDPSASEEELRDFLAESFAKWWLPDRFLFVDEVPKTSVGKYDKKVVRAAIAERGLEGAEQHMRSGIKPQV